MDGQDIHIGAGAGRAAGARTIDDDGQAEVPHRRLSLIRGKRMRKKQVRVEQPLEKGQHREPGGLVRDLAHEWKRPIHLIGHGPPESDLLRGRNPLDLQPRSGPIMDHSPGWSRHSQPFQIPFPLELPEALRCQ